MKAKIIILFVCISVVGITVYYGIKKSSAIKQHCIIVDPVGSQALRQSIMHYIQCHPRQPSLVWQLKKIFPGIAKVQWQHKVPGCMRIEVQCHQPLLKINNTVLCTKSTIAPLWTFNECSYKDLPQLFCSNIGVLAKAPLRNYIRSLHTTLFEHYTVTITDEHEITLRDNDYDFFSIITSCQIPLTDAMVQRCCHLKNLVMNKAHYQKYQWVADIRYKDQIILKKYRGRV